MAQEYIEVDYGQPLARTLAHTSLRVGSTAYLLENVKHPPELKGRVRFDFRFTREQPVAPWRQAGVEHGIALYEQHKSSIKWGAVYLMGAFNFAEEGDVGGGWFPYLNGDLLSIGEGGLYEDCVYLQVQPRP